MKKTNVWMIVVLLVAAMMLTACGNNNIPEEDYTSAAGSSDITEDPEQEKESISLTGEIMELSSGLSAVRFDGEYGFDAFLEQGGASSDADVVEFLMSNMLSGMQGMSFGGDMFGCSTISVKSPEGDLLFGRNFDWNHCNAMIVQSVPTNGYASISTVNMDFISGVKAVKL